MGRMAEMDDLIRRSKLYKAMVESGKYKDGDEVVEIILEIAQEVDAGADPTEELYNEGFEPDFVEDILDVINLWRRRTPRK